MIYSLNWFLWKISEHVFQDFSWKWSWNEIINVENSTFLDILLIISVGAPFDFRNFLLYDVKFDGES